MPHPRFGKWHWDAVTHLPPDSTLLMSSPAYENQAFRVGERAWGIQFHVETPPEMVQQWACSLDEPSTVLSRTLPALDEVAEVWSEVLRRFARLAV